MSLSDIFDDPQPRDLRVVHFQRAAIKTFGELQNLTRIHKADKFNSNQIHSSIATNLTPGNPIVNQKLTFSSPIPNRNKSKRIPVSIPVLELSDDKPTQVSEFLRDRLAQRELMEESTESLTRRYLANKEPNALERRYLAASNIECNRNSIQDPYSRMIMFYKYLIYHFGEKRVAILKKFFSTNKQALSVRFRIIDVQNDGYISAEEMRNICLQFATNSNRDAINEIVDFVRENGRIYYKCFLLSSSGLSNRMLYGEDSRTKLGSVKQLTDDSPLTGDEIIRRKRQEFEKLVELCKERNIILSKRSLERALLLPENRTMDDIFQHFTGISLTRPSSKPGYQYGDGNSSESESELGEPNSILTYLSNRKPVRKKVILSTGKATLGPKVDCWLNFKDYLKLTIFNKKSDLFYAIRGPLPDCKRYLTEPNAFWTGSNDNLYPYIPHKAKSLNPTNVHFKRIDRHYDVTANTDTKHGLNSWPVNKAGYVQYGSLPDKQCAL